MTNQDIPDSVFDFVSQMSHWLGAVFLILAPVMLWGEHVKWYFTGAILILAAIKEFFLDCIMETPSESGGLIGDIVDFSMYGVGIIIAHLVIHFGKVCI